MWSEVIAPSQGFCPAKFACVGCPANASDPAKRYQIESRLKWTTAQREETVRQGLTLDTARFDQHIRACHTMLREMDLLERWRADEERGHLTLLPSSEPPAWLGEVYERRRRRTVRLVQLSIAALTRAGERGSLAAIARVSKTIDPAEPHGVSESAILHDDEAYALYRQHADHKRQMARKPSPNRRVDLGDDHRIRVNADRDRGRGPSAVPACE
jgi:hypothetical protein